MGRQADQAFLDHRANPARPGFPIVPACLGFPTVPTWLGRRVGLAHLDYRARFQIYHELKI